MKKLIIPGALIGMAALIGVAMIVDCVRLANDARHRVELADEEMAKQEQRLVKVLEASTDRPSQVNSALERYKSVVEIPARHLAYQELVAAFQGTMSDKIDAANPLNRKFMDDAAGAINRRQIAERSFDEELLDYGEFLLSWRGRVASAFTETVPRQPRAD